MIDILEEGETLMSFFLDLSKAFDCLSNELMLTKLRNLDFKDTAALSWLWRPEWMESTCGAETEPERDQ